MSDLIAELEKRAAVVIHVDLTALLSEDPADLVIAGIRRTFMQLSAPHSALLARLKARSEVGGNGAFSVAISVEHLGKAGGTSLAHAITELVDRARTNVVLVVNEVQELLRMQQGTNLLFALKAARDAVNLRREAMGRFVLIGMGSSHSELYGMVRDGMQAFQGAEFHEIPAIEQCHGQRPGASTKC